jgi:hypothetical protein
VSFFRRPKHFAVIASLVFVVSVLKGLRMPNLWSATHMTFNYSQGFIRRGLVGEILRILGGQHPYDYNRLALIAGLMFVTLGVTMVLLIKRALATDAEDLGFKAAVLVFAASPGIVTLAHFIGYLDFLGLILVLGVILVSARPSRRHLIFYLGIPLGSFVAFIHESQVLMLAPTLLFAMICHIVMQFRRGDASRRAKFLPVAAAAFGFVLAFATSTTIGIVGTKSPEVIHALQDSISKVANFPLRGDAFEAVYRPVGDAIFKLIPWFWSIPENQTYLALSMISAFPAIAFLIFYGVRLIGRLGLSKIARTILTTAFVVAALAPVSLNFLGWDTTRWNAISLMACFYCIATVRLYFASQLEGESNLRVDSPLVLTLAAAAIVLGLCSSNYDRFLFDGYTTQWFPFQGQVNSLIELFKGHFTFVPRS